MRETIGCRHEEDGAETLDIRHLASRRHQDEVASRGSEPDEIEPIVATINANNPCVVTVVIAGG
jgi:hypothetical protein